ncbi:MAG TPA: hypothetical protein VG712_03010, partial [Gemmatimonadales bacterium]|nr:hypothetical protein [Gemmatimonadales bacterium]
MTIRRLVQFLFGGLLILALAAAGLIVGAAIRRRQLVDLQRRHFVSYQLADELRHSSDDLTRLVRLYVVTGDPTYETYYRTVLAIRDGTAPRPEHYERVYWDLYLATGRPPRNSEPPVALLTLMQNAGYTAEELDSLRTALARSTALAAVEDAAFHALRGEFRDAQGRFTIRGRPDTGLARRLVFDSAYTYQKARIMAPIEVT